MSGDVAMETISSSSSKLLSDDRQEGDETKEPKESSPVPEDERDPSTLTAFADPKQETEAQRAAEMFDRRGSRMEDTGDIQVLSALPEFQLLLPSRDWSDRSWTLRRLLCRLATLFVLVAMMVVVVTIGGFYGSNNRYTEGFLPLNLTLYNFRLDGCYLDFYANQGSDVVDSSHVRISLYVEYWTWMSLLIQIVVLCRSLTPGSWAIGTGTTNAWSRCLFQWGWFCPKSWWTRSVTRTRG